MHSIYRTKIIQILSFLSILIVFCLFSQSLQADTIKLSDGSVVVGKVAKMEGGTLTIETSFAGTIEISMDKVVMIQTDVKMPIHLEDGSVIQGTLKASDENAIEVIRKEDETSMKVEPSGITSINPTPPPPIRWKGKVIGTFSLTDGNSETLGAGLEANASRRTDMDRITLRAGYFYQEDEKNATRDDQYAFAKYDYYFHDKMYGYLNGRIYRDGIKNLELRTTGGGGLGYTFLEDDIFNLSAEGGISYYSEDYSGGLDDKRNASARLAGNFDWWIVKKTLLFEQDLEGLISVEDSEDFLLYSDSRLSWYFTERWSINGAVRFEYLNVPAAGNERVDTKYMVGVGYEF
jgi:putative salt-induced outer membrane protein YdiY